MTARAFRRYGGDNCSCPHKSLWRNVLDRVVPSRRNDRPTKDAAHRPVCAAAGMVAHLAIVTPSIVLPAGLRLCQLWMLGLIRTAPP